MSGIDRSLLHTGREFQIHPALVVALGHNAARAIVFTCIAQHMAEERRHGERYWRTTGEGLAGETGLTTEAVSLALRWLTRAGHIETDGLLGYRTVTEDER